MLKQLKPTGNSLINLSAICILTVQMENVCNCNIYCAMFYVLHICFLHSNNLSQALKYCNFQLNIYVGYAFHFAYFTVSISNY